MAATKSDTITEEEISRLKKFIAEVIGTYFVVFAGCGSVAVNKIYGEVTFPGVCVTWGLIVMVMNYSVGHISGAHFNPAVTITFAIFRRFPSLEVPVYIAAQLMGSILASGTLALLFEITPKAYFGTVPVGSNAQSLVLEIIISFLLMFVISGVSTDNRAIGEMAGIAVGMTILLNVFVAGRISGASMNPARSIGPAIVKHVYKGLWILGYFEECYMRKLTCVLSRIRICILYSLSIDFDFSDVGLPVSGTIRILPLDCLNLTAKWLED
ncbi:hypothetical protein FNV43_RR14045 [Rhamnella rubrinervis]|uniref:Aquaporin n=1 Tax=Rhamnella rubrinervis TaxID=2594499 RepID=A0A8K0H2A0_9ROSA|nr:hypothetical protein FNV43_RR14045 [Rhamnella rubrinervis]